MGTEIRIFRRSSSPGFSPILVPLYLRAVNGRVVHPKHETEFSDIGTVFWTVQDWILKASLQASFGSGTARNAGIFVVNCFSKQFSSRVSGLLNG